MADPTQSPNKDAGGARGLWASYKRIPRHQRLLLGLGTVNYSFVRSFSSEGKTADSLSVQSQHVPVTRPNDRTSGHGGGRFRFVSWFKNQWSNHHTSYSKTTRINLRKMICFFLQKVPEQINLKPFREQKQTLSCSKYPENQPRKKSTRKKQFPRKMLNLDSYLIRTSLRGWCVDLSDV